MNPTVSTNDPPRFAKLRPERARLYPSIDRGTWWSVVNSDDLGVRVDLGKREQFIFWQDVETRGAEE